MTTQTTEAETMTMTISIESADGTTISEHSTLDRAISVAHEIADRTRRTVYVMHSVYRAEEIEPLPLGQVHTLRAQAAAEGDDELRDQCEEALIGDESAMGEVCAMIREWAR